VEDTVHVIARQGPVISSDSFNQHRAPNEAAVTVVCESGTLRLTLQKGELTRMTTPGDQWQLKQSVKLKRDDSFVAQANAYLDAVEQNSPVLCSIPDGAQTLRATPAAFRCADSGAAMIEV